MSFSQADIQVIQTVFGKTFEEISGALSSEQEVSLGLRLNGRVITQEEEGELKEKGIQQGKQIGYKEIAKGLDLSLDSGEKDPLIIAEKLKTTLSSTLEEKYKGQTPSDELTAALEKNKDWENKYNKLNGTYEETVSKVGELEHKYTGLQEENKNKELNNTILKSFPDKMKMDKDDALLIARNSFNFEHTDNGLVVKKDGQIVTDPVGNPATVDTIIKSFVEEKKWIKGSGMNGSDRGGSGSRFPKGLDHDAAVKYIKEAGHDPMDPKGSEMYIEVTASE